MRGIERMVQDDRDCVDILTQMSAIQAALDKVSLGLLDGHARSFLAMNDSQEPHVGELMEAVGRMLGRR